MTSAVCVFPPVPKVNLHVMPKFRSPDVNEFQQSPFVCQGALDLQTNIPWKIDAFRGLVIQGIDVLSTRGDSITFQSPRSCALPYC